MKLFVNGYIMGVWYIVKIFEIFCLLMWINFKSIYDFYFIRLGISYILFGLGELMFKYNLFRFNKYGKDKIFFENEMDF